MLYITNINMLKITISPIIFSVIIYKYLLIPLLALCSLYIHYNLQLSPYWILGLVFGEGSLTYFTLGLINGNSDNKVDYTFIF